MRTVGKILVGFFALIGFLSIFALIWAYVIAPVRFTIPFINLTVEGPLMWRIPTVTVEKITCGDLQVKPGKKLKLILTVSAHTGAETQRGRMIIFDPVITRIGDQARNDFSSNPPVSKFIEYGKNPRVPVEVNAPRQAGQYHVSVAIFDGEDYVDLSTCPTPLTVQK